MEVSNNRLMLGGIPSEKLVEDYGSPLYVYEEDKIIERYRDLVENIRHDRLKIYYACKANTNIEILKILRKLGSNIEAVSRGEVLAALKAGFKPGQVMFSCDNIHKDELEFIAKEKIRINIDSLSQLRKYGKINPGASVGIRVNQGIGAGHHNHVITGGPLSKFGIYYSQLDEAMKIAKEFDLKIDGLHQHIGSNVLDQSIFLQAMKAVISTAKKFKNINYINFGGGFGVPYKPGEKHLNMKMLGNKIVSLFDGFCKSSGQRPEMIFEPGRYLVCESGFLLTTVTDIKKTPKRTFVGVDSGFNHLIRPVLYGSYHPIINASSVNGTQETISIAGNICESGDLFADNRNITKCKEGNVLAILNAGAYGFVMSSNYNSRPKPAEVMVKNGKSMLIRKREAIAS